MVDRVVAIAKHPEKIRNIAICAHIDHGKTTFSDNLLAGAGMMSEELAGEARVLDFHEDEQKRGITIDSASVSMVHDFKGDEHLINLIDTPGHVDFGGDVTRAMRAVDGCIVLVDAVEGIMPQTETVLRQALKERVKPVLFINKVDRLIKELQLTPEQMQERFIKVIGDVNELILQIAEKEFGERWQINVQNGTVAFGSAYHKWALSISFMKENGITFKDVINAYQSGDEGYKQLAKKAQLHEVVLNMVITHHPNPNDAQKYRIPKIWRGDIESQEGKDLLDCNPTGKLFFVITKIIIDPQAGEIAYGRLFSGTMTKGTEVYLNRAKQKARIQQVFIANGAKREIIQNVPSGNIVAIGGLKALVGETVTDEPTTPFQEITHLFDPVISKSIEAAKPSELAKLVQVLITVQKEDPSLKIEINEETGEHLMHGMGELHLEIIENRIKSEKGIDIRMGPPIVVYREAITKQSPEVEGKSPNKHNKFYIKVEPVSEELASMIREDKMPSGRFKKKQADVIEALRSIGWDSKLANKVKAVHNGNVFVEATRGEVHMIEVIEMILDMFEDVMKAGPLAKEPCINVMITLTDVKLHEDAIHRGPAQVYPAVRDSIRGAMMQASPVLYEPLQILLIEAPVEFMGNLTKLVTSKRGNLIDMNQQGALTIVKAKMPVAEMIGWSNDLRSSTEGRGNFSIIDQVFEKVPNELQQEVTSRIVKRKGLGEGQLGA
jgi:elongation factor 2